MTRDFPPFLRDMLDTPPRAGEGVHDWLFRVARQLHAHLPGNEIIRLLTDKVQQCGRPVPAREILSAVQNALSVAWKPNGNAAPAVTSKWPSLNSEKRTQIIASGGGLVDLWEASPVWIDENESYADEVVAGLFPGNPLLCCGKSNSEFETKTFDDWFFSLANMSLIVPSPMTSLTGLTKDGRQSAHALDNTGPRRFLIVEFDTGSTDEHAALLMHLAEFAPLVCAVHSGGKSLHGWFFVARSADEKIEKFFRYAVSLGADPRLWTRSQFCRMPGGRRENGNHQAVYFLNFQPLK